MKSIVRKIRNALTVFVMLQFLISCPNDVMRDLVETKVSDPVPQSMEINNGMPGTPARTVTISADVSKENDVLEMRLKNETGSWSSWMPYSKNVTWNLSDGDGVKTVYVEVRDQGQHTVSLISTIILDTTVPEGGFKVRGTNTYGIADSYINTGTAVLFMNVTGAYYMRFSNDGGPFGGWMPYAPSTLWTLSPGDGLKTVEAEFGDIAYNPAGDPQTPHEITLDTTAPSASAFQINSGDATTNNASVGLSYTCTEINRVWAQYMNDGASWSAEEEIAAGGVTKIWSLRGVNGTRTASVRLTDIAGNVSSVYSDSIYLNTLAPEPPVPSAVTPTNNDQPVWSWASVAGATQYRIQLNSLGGSWTNLGSSLSWTPPIGLGAGTHTLYVQAADVAGNWSGTGSFAVFVDLSTPGAPAPSAPTPTNDATPTWNWAAIAGAVEYRVSFDNNNWESNNTSTAYTASALGEGNHTLYVQSRNAAGTWSPSGTHTVLIDVTTPSLSAFTFSSSNANSAYAKTGDTITVTFTATDINGINLSDSDATIGGNSAVINHVSGNNYTATRIMTAGDTEGVVGLSLNIRDNAGNNRSAGGTTSITFDKTPPAVTISLPSLVYAKSGTAVTYTVTYTGADDITLSTANISTVEGGTADITVTSVNGSGNTRTVTVTAGTGDGTARINILGGTAVDEAGNLAAGALSEPFTVDNTPPGVPSVSVPTYVTGSAVFTWNPVIGASDYRYSFSSGGPWTQTGNIGSLSLGLASGSYTFYLQAGDAAGNWSSSGSATTTFYNSYIDFEGAVSPGSMLFGGRNSPAPAVTIGAGQSISVLYSMTLKTFAFYLAQTFGQEVVVQLDIRTSDGSITGTYNTTVSAGFSGGWVYWTGISNSLTAGSTYIFTAFVKNVVGTSIASSIRADVSDSFAGGSGYDCIQQSDANMSVWSNWAGKGAWDFWFRLYGD